MATATAEKPKATAEKPKRLLTIKEVAGETSLCSKSIRNHCVPNGSLRFTRIGKSLRFRPADVEAWIESRTEGLD